VRHVCTEETLDNIRVHLEASAGMSLKTVISTTKCIKVISALMLKLAYSVLSVQQ
jgi:hypothetical protein